LLETTFGECGCRACSVGPDAVGRFSPRNTAPRIRTPRDHLSCPSRRARRNHPSDRAVTCRASQGSRRAPVAACRDVVRVGSDGAALLERGHRPADSHPRCGRVSVATAYRYLHEAIDVIAAHASELPDVLTEGLREGWAFVCLDGTLIPSTRCSAPVGSATTYGTPVNTTSTAATSRSWPTPPGGRCRPVTSNPDPPTTSPPPASTPCPPSTRSRSRLAHPHRQGLRQRRHRNRRPDQGQQPRSRQPHPPPHHQRTPCAGRTRQHPRTWKALERGTLDPRRIGAITTAALVLLQLQKPTR